MAGEKSYICETCHEFVMKSAVPHACSGKAIPSMSNMWGLPYVAPYEMNQYTFPDLAEILDQLDSYILSLRGKPSWPAVSKTLKLKSEITDPGMVLVLGNPKKVNHECVCDILNPMLPGVSYKTIHSNYKGPANFRFTNIAGASAFFQKTGAINIMPGDTGWSGSAIPNGGVFVNAHSGCAPGLMVHEIVHAYGGPGGMFGEGLTDWFTLDMMKSWGKSYDGNPAYAYNVALVQRVVEVAGKERVARMTFCDEETLNGLKVTKPTGKMVLGKAQTKTTTWRTVVALRGTVTDLALQAQKATMKAGGMTDDQIATSVPKAATAEQENAAGLPKAIGELAQALIDLLPD